MKYLYTLVLFILILSSCMNKYEYWDITKFNIDTASIVHGEEIKMIYSSRGPDNNINKEYYIHMIAVSQKTGDTVNILTFEHNELEANDGDKIFYFISQTKIDAKFKNKHDNYVFQNEEDLRYIPYKKIEKVVRDPQFDKIANNSYPTVVGFISNTKLFVE